MVTNDDLVGSKEKVEAEITETLQGRVSLLFPTSHIYKNIYVYQNNSQFHGMSSPSEIHPTEICRTIEK